MEDLEEVVHRKIAIYLFLDNHMILLNIQSSQVVVVDFSYITANNLHQVAVLSIYKHKI
jgi:hypothetical protein